MAHDLSTVTPAKIVLLVLDGLGGLPDPQTSKTELETARTPNLDNLAVSSICGLSLPVGHGITPGSAPGHLALFGYDPLKTFIGRGILEALGIDEKVEPGDLAARGNFCTVDKNGVITDRRAGRISTEKAAGLCRLLDGQVFGDITVRVKSVREHRFVAIFKGRGLSSEVTDTDPQRTGVSPRPSQGSGPAGKFTAGVINQFIKSSARILEGLEPANMIVLRGFSGLPTIPTLKDCFKLNPAAIAAYPMYRGLARLAGMEILHTGNEIEDEITTLEEYYPNYDFFFIHVKGTDSAGEDGDFSRKVAVIEHVDSIIPRIADLHPEVMIVTGDHSTPAVLGAHSWHPVPLMIYGKYCRADGVSAFSETACLSGGLGIIRAREILTLAMANALKLDKFGA